jgi:hypothetical protein
VEEGTQTTFGHDAAITGEVEDNDDETDELCELAPGVSAMDGDNK